MEEWRDIVGYEGLYKISNVGNVMNNKGRILKLMLTNGYPTVNLYKNRKMRSLSVHKYAFRTSEDVEVGDLIESNAQTGELRNGINSTKMYPIKTIIFKEEDELVVYATKVEDSQN